MTICSPEEASPEGNIACEGEQIVIFPSHKGSKCYIIPNSNLYRIFHIKLQRIKRY